MTVRDALDDSMKSQTSEVVAHLIGTVGVVRQTQELCHLLPQRAMAHRSGIQREQRQGMHEGKNPAIAEAKARGSLPLDHRGFGHGTIATLSDEAVMAQGLGAQ